MNNAIRHDLTGDKLPSLPFPLCRLTVWERRPLSPAARPVLYVHGATFPTACAFTFPFDGLSWADHLAQQGFWPWGLDFAGFGGSSIPWADVGAAAGPLGRAAEAASQIEAAVRYVLGRTGYERLDMIAHSWGTIAAGIFASQRPERLGRLVLFGPIVRREDQAARPVTQVSRLVTTADQYRRFTGYLPQGQKPVLNDRQFSAWAEVYLDSDAESHQRRPAAVCIPAGPAADIADLWAGQELYDPARIPVPVAILRGEWDSLSTDRDVAGLRAALSAAATVRDIKLPRGTHVMHLETGRSALWSAAANFLAARVKPACAETAD